LDGPEVLERIRDQSDSLMPGNAREAFSRAMPGAPAGQDYQHIIRGNIVFLQRRSTFIRPAFGVNLEIDPAPGGSRITGQVALAPRTRATLIFLCVVTVIVLVFILKQVVDDLSRHTFSAVTLAPLLLPITTFAVGGLILWYRRRKAEAEVARVNTWLRKLFAHELKD
jgi:uncharacterized integral membrane protein